MPYKFKPGLVTVTQNGKAVKLDGLAVPSGDAEVIPGPPGPQGNSIIYGDLVDPAAASDSRTTINSLISKHTRFMFDVKNASRFRAGDIAVVPGQYNDAPRVRYMLYCDVDKVSGNRLEVYAKQTVENGERGSAGKDGFVYPISPETAPTKELTPNTFYVWGEMPSLTITLGAELPGVVNEYVFQFSSGSSPTTLSVPDTVKWVSGNTIEANKTYQVSIINNIGVIGGA